MFKLSLTQEDRMQKQVYRENLTYHFLVTETLKNRKQTEKKTVETTITLGCFTDPKTVVFVVLRRL